MFEAQQDNRNCLACAALLYDVYVWTVREGSASFHTNVKCLNILYV